jgi:YHS domain-containing protein
MQILLRVLLIFFILYLLRRFLAGFMKFSKKSPAADDSRNPENRMVKDPVCGMYMDPRLAIKLGDHSSDVFFCSEECKKKFVGKPPDGGIGNTAAGRS